MDDKPPIKPWQQEQQPRTGWSFMHHDPYGRSNKDDSAEGVSSELKPQTVVELMELVAKEDDAAGLVETDEPIIQEQISPQRTRDVFHVGVQRSGAPAVDMTNVFELRQAPLRKSKPPLPAVHSADVIPFTGVNRKFKL